MMKGDKHKMTYGNIYDQFLNTTSIDKDVVDDYRPCCPLFDVPPIPDAIVVFLKNGGKIIYIADEKLKTEPSDYEVQVANKL